MTFAEKHGGGSSLKMMNCEDWSEVSFFHRGTFITTTAKRQKKKKKMSYFVSVAVFLLLTVQVVYANVKC